MSAWIFQVHDRTGPTSDILLSVACIVSSASKRRVKKIGPAEYKCLNLGSLNNTDPVWQILICWELCISARNPFRGKWLNWQFYQLVVCAFAVCQVFYLCDSDAGIIISGVCPGVLLCVCLSAKKNQKTMSIHVNGESEKGLHFGDIWPWPFDFARPWPFDLQANLVFLHGDISTRHPPRERYRLYTQQMLWGPVHISQMGVLGQSLSVCCHGTCPI